MIWIVSIIVGALLIQLGALSVLVSVFALGFKVALVVIVLLTIVILWRHFRCRC